MGKIQSTPLECHWFNEGIVAEFKSTYFRLKKVIHDKLKISILIFIDLTENRERYTFKILNIIRRNDILRFHA